jgi:hypothetical protein
MHARTSATNMSSPAPLRARGKEALLLVEGLLEADRGAVYDPGGGGGVDGGGNQSSTAMFVEPPLLHSPVT